MIELLALSDGTTLHAVIGGIGFGGLLLGLSIHAWILGMNDLNKKRLKKELKEFDKKLKKVKPNKKMKVSVRSAKNKFKGK